MHTPLTTDADFDHAMWFQWPVKVKIQEMPEERGVIVNHTEHSVHLDNGSYFFKAISEVYVENINII